MKFCNFIPKGIMMIVFLGCIRTTCIVPNLSLGSYLKGGPSKYLKGGVVEEVILHVAQGADSSITFVRKATLLKRPGARVNVVICHGYMCNKYDTGFLRTFFPDYNVLMFDFRAHGEQVDDNQCCTFGRDEAYEVTAAATYFKNHPELKHFPRIGYGFSMGAVAAIQAQSQDSSLFHALILDCPYDSSANVIKHGIEKMKINLFGYTFNLPGRHLLEKYAFHPYVQSMLKVVLKTVANLDATATNTYIYPLNPAESIKKIKAPCMFIHCLNDDKIPVQAAKELYQGHTGYKRLWITQGRRHFDSFFYNPEKYVYKINQFIKKTVSGDIGKKQQQKIWQDLSA